MNGGLPERTAIAIAVAVRRGRILVARRAPHAHLGGTWEFPGGKLEPGEAPEDAARRELREETGLHGGAIEPLVTAVFDYPDRRLRLHAFVVREPEGEVAVDAGREWGWREPGDLPVDAMPPANGPIVRALHWRLGTRRDDE